MSTRDRSILAVLAGVIALAAFWFVVLGPKRAEGEKLDSALAAGQQRLATAQGTVAAGTTAKAGYADDSATIARLGKAVPADDDLPSLLYQIQSSAKGADVDFGALERGAANGGANGVASTTGTAGLPPGAVVGTAGFATLPFSFTFTGSYFALEHLLDDLHGYVNARGDAVSVRGRLLTVDGFSLSAGDAGLSKISAKVSASAYLVPDTAASSGSTATTPGTGATATPAAPTSSAITGGAS
jgi:Tfp pilus assembly protein PilO